MRLRQHTSQQGGSLLEVMICLFMLTTAIFGVTSLKLTQAQIILQQSQYTAAWALMEYKLNEIRYLTDSIDGFNALNTNLGGHISAGDIHYDQHQFNLTWQVSSLSTITTSNQRKEVVIEIHWLDQTNTAQMIRNKTMLSQGVMLR